MRDPRSARKDLKSSLVNSPPLSVEKYFNVAVLETDVSDLMAFDELFNLQCRRKICL
jgi:hypothetical protein